MAVACKNPSTDSGDGRRTDWLAGLVVGAVAGVLTLIFPTLGWGIVVVFGLLVVRNARRIPAFGGLFLGLGASWIGLLLRAHLACEAFDAGPGQECLDPDLGPWLVVGSVFLAIGIAATVAALRSNGGVKHRDPEASPAPAAAHARTALSVLPWFLLLVMTAGSAALNLAGGGYGLLFALSPAWLLAVVFQRAVASRFGQRAPRLLADAAFAAICLFLAPFGGWWVLPAVFVFGLLDAATPTETRQPSWRPPAQLEILLGGLTVLAAFALTLWLANASVYSYQSTSVTDTGAVTETQGSYGLPIATGLVFLVVPAAVVMWGVLRDRQEPGAGRPMIAIVAVVLAILSVLGGFSIGMYLVPIAVLAVLTFLAAPHRGRP